MRNPHRSLLLIAIILIVSGCNGQPAPHTVNPQIEHVQKATRIARDFEDKGDTKTAIKYHKHALKKSEEYSLPEYQARSLINIAGILKNDSAGESLEYLRKALDIAEQINSHELRANIFLAMSGIYKQQENYREALNALSEHQKLLSRTFASNQAKELAHIEAEGRRKLERYTYLIIIIFVILSALLLAAYYFRTAKLNKDLQSSNKIKDKLFSIIGHDLRGPASGIMGALEIIDSGILSNEEEREIIRLLKKQSLSFNDTLNTLLSWASTQLKGANTEMTHFDPRVMIQKSLDILEGQAREKNITFNVQAPDGLSVNADPNHIDFIIRNLLSNAIKFSHENSEIDISVKEEDKQIIIAILDHGIGIPEAKQKRFSVFSGMESTFGTKGEHGTGLGLMLSNEFIRENKGRIWLKSMENIGTTFFVALQKG